MKQKLAILLVLALVLLGGAASAVVQPGEDFYYLDTANVLSEEAEGTIFFCNQLLEEKCGAQIVIAALDSIGNEDIYDYAYNMFNEWGIGSAVENNGMLLLMAIEEDNYYALSGAGVDRILSSAVLQEYLDDELEPGFARKDYEEGTLAFFSAVLDRYADYYNLNLSIRDGEAAYESYLESNSAGANLGGAQGGGAAMDGPTSVWHSEPGYGNEEEGGIFDMIIWIVVLIVVLSIVFGGRRRGGVFFMPVFRGRPYHHYHHVHHRPPMHHHSAPRRSPPPRTGGFSGAGRSGFSGGRSGGGFGGARGGGGRSFGGGAGRGRH